MNVKELIQHPKQFCQVAGLIGPFFACSGGEFLNAPAGVFDQGNGDKLIIKLEDRHARLNAQRADFIAAAMNNYLTTPGTMQGELGL